MKKSEHSEKYCAVARTLGVLEDSWSFLIIRNAFLGAKRFNDFQQQLGLNRQLLSARLKKFVDSGVMKKVEDRDDRRREAYLLTKKGRELYPIVVSMVHWGNTWALGDDEPPVLHRHEPCGKLIEPVLVCSCCREELAAEDVTAIPSLTYSERAKGLEKQSVAALFGYVIQEG